MQVVGVRVAGVVEGDLVEPGELTVVARHDLVGLDDERISDGRSQLIADGGNPIAGWGS